MPTAHTQLVKDSINNQGATAPCVGIEVGLGIIKKCVDTFANAGFIRLPEVGYSGLTLGPTAADDATVTAIAPGSPAEQAGLHTGDRILAVDSTPIVYHPGAAAQQAIFGPRGEDLHLKIRRGGAPLDITLKQAQLAPPPGPKSPSFMIIMHPIIDWRGVIIPCMGGGIAAPAAFAYCDKHFKPFGYLKFGELATVGLHFDLKRTDLAIVESIDPNSPAANAGMKPGDELVTVDEKPLAPNLTEQVNEHIFGRAGTSFVLTVHRGSQEQKATLTLAPKPEKQ